MYIMSGSGILRVLGWIIGWAWAFFTAIAGLELIITRGPWPPTNGWFVLFSGLSACPLTAWFLRHYRQVNFPPWARFTVAFLFVVAGRLALMIEGRAGFLPTFSSH